MRRSSTWSLLVFIMLASCVKKQRAFSVSLMQAFSKQRGWKVCSTRFRHVAFASTAVNKNELDKDDRNSSKVNNTQLRLEAFDSILFDHESRAVENVPDHDYGDSFSPFDFSELEELPDKDDATNRNRPRASSIPPEDGDYGDSFSPFDFSDLEEQLPNTVEKEDGGYPLVSNTRAQILNEEPPSLEKDELAPPNATAAASTNGASFHERHSLHVLEKASFGNGITTDVHMLESQLQNLEKEIYAQHNGKTFNINSPKQVSKVLFGVPNESTNKEKLEAMDDYMAGLILKHRACSRAIKRAKRKQSEQNSVKNVMKTHRRSELEKDTENALLLLDASAYIFRAYYSMPPLHRSDGMPVGAVLGFCNMLNRLVLHRLLIGERPRLVLVFDAKGKTFRHDLYEDYKSNRKDCPMDLVPQFDLIRQVAEAYGIQQLEAAGYEADDVIATLATRAVEEGVDVNILSGDKDLMQLITSEEAVPSVHMIDPMKMSRITHDVVLEKWGVPPSKVGDILALAGDASDNIPGVPGIGPKIAAQLLNQFGSLDKLLEDAETITQKARREKILENKDKALLSKRLVELECEIPLQNMTFPEDAHGRVADLRMEELDSQRLLQLYEQMGFKDLKRRFQDRLMQRDRRNAIGKTASTKPKRRFKKRPKAEIPQPKDYDQVPF